MTLTTINIILIVWTMAMLIVWTLCAIAGQVDDEAEKMGRVRRVK